MAAARQLLLLLYLKLGICAHIIGKGAHANILVNTLIEQSLCEEHTTLVEYTD